MSKFVLFCDNVDEAGNVRDSWDESPTEEQLLDSLLPYYDQDKAKELAYELFETGDVYLQDCDCTVFRLEEIY